MLMIFGKAICFALKCKSLHRWKWIFEWDSMRSLVASWIFPSRTSHVSLLTWSTSFLLKNSICCQKCCRCDVPSSFGNLWICKSCWAEMIIKSRVIKFSGLSGNVQTKSLDQHFECLQNVYVFAYVINKIESDIPCWAQCPSNHYIVHIKPNW